MQDDRRNKKASIKNLRQESSAYELATSPDMELYLKLAMAVMQNADPTMALEAIRQLPLKSATCGA